MICTDLGRMILQRNRASGFSLNPQIFKWKLKRLPALQPQTNQELALYTGGVGLLGDFQATLGKTELLESGNACMFQFVSIDSVGITQIPFRLSAGVREGE